MKRAFSYILFSVCCFSTHLVFAQCGVDVTIQEGAAISMCENAPETINASGGYVSYTWTGPETLSGQSIVPNFSGTYQVDAEDGVGCISSATIDVTINPVPVDNIISSEGNTLCPSSSGTVLSLSGTYALYQWSTGEMSPTITVDAGGTYSVGAADMNGCVGQFSIDIEEVVFGLANSQNGNCGSGSVALTASGGTSYLWSTGETGSTIVVSPASPTSYSVTITNGTCVEQLSTIATVVDNSPQYEMVDTLYIQPGDNQYILGPEGFDSYHWFPGHLVSDSTAQGVYFTGDSTVTLFVEAITDEGCYVLDQVTVVVVRLTIPTGFSPNDDNYNDAFVVPELDSLIAELTVYNRYGDIVYHSWEYENDWNGDCEGRGCIGDGRIPEGTYFYEIKVKDIVFKGYLTVKRSIQ